MIPQITILQTSLLWQLKWHLFKASVFTRVYKLSSTQVYDVQRRSLAGAYQTLASGGYKYIFFTDNEPAMWPITIKTVASSARIEFPPLSFAFARLEGKSYNRSETFVPALMFMICRCPSICCFAGPLCFSGFSHHGFQGLGCVVSK